MKRNKVLKVLLSVAVLGTFSTSLNAAKKVKWKLAMTWPSTLTPLASPGHRVAKLVNEMSGGNFTIKVHGKEKHKAALGIFDMVKNKQYEIGHSASYYYKGKDINTIWFTTVPFGMTMKEQYAWTYYGDGMKYMKKVYDKFGMLIFPGGSTGVQMGGWFRKSIDTVADLKGIKMRIPGLAGEVLAKLGVNVTNIPAGELYTSLDRGTIDALEWVGPGMDIKMGFHKVASYYYTGWHEPGAELNFFVNQRAFKKLSSENKAILKAAMRVAASDMYTENFYDSVEAWDKMKTDFPNIKVSNFPQPVFQAIKDASDAVYAKYSATNPLFKEIYENQQEFIRKARSWSKMGEYDYIKTSDTLK